MFSREFKEYFRQVGVKITLWYLLLLSVTMAGLFVVFYILYSQSLIKNERSIIEEKIRVFEQVYREGGVKGLKNYFDRQDVETDRRSDYFVRIETSDHQRLFYYAGQAQKSIIESEVENFIAQKKSKITSQKEWFYIKTNSPEDDLEMHNKLMSDGNYLQIGKLVDDRDDLLEHFVELYLILFILSLFLGWFGGVFLSSRILLPVRNLIETLRNINKGTDKLRLQKTGTNDELSDLTDQFNLMLEHVEKTNESMRSTLDIISHELRTPLTSFRARAELALANQKSEVELRESMHDLIEGIDEILVEFKMMMEITEMESGATNLHVEYFDIKSVLQEVFDLYDMVAESQNIVLFFNLNRSIKLTGDRRKLKQALANLVDNAIKYSNPGTRVEVNYYSEKNSLKITVKDYGIGIPVDELPLVFKRLYRGSNGRVEKGIGLGLSLVQIIIAAHKGTIDISSEINKGTMFTITLPLNE